MTLTIYDCRISRDIDPEVVDVEKFKANIPTRLPSETDRTRIVPLYVALEMAIDYYKQHKSRPTVRKE